MRSLKALFKRVKDEFYPPRDEFDRTRNVKTNGRMWKGRLDVPSETKKNAIGYQAVDPTFFAKAIACLPREAFDARFVDLGCGKGRALILAQEAGFTKITGVELSSKLAAAAEANVSAYVEVICGDASKYEFTDRSTVIFLYNPFSAEVLARVLLNLKGTANVWVIYINPVHADIVILSGMCEIGSGRGWKVWWQSTH